MHQTLLNWTTVIFFYKLEHATSILLSRPLNKKGHIKLPYTYLLNLICYKLSYWVEVPFEGAEKGFSPLEFWGFRKELHVQ